MARYNPTDYNRLRMIPLSLEDQLEPGTLEYAISYIIEERLDLSFFDERYRNDNTGRKAIDPKILLKIILFGYSRGMFSTRPLERACNENVTFMALACCHKPDRSTIAAFVSSMGKEVEVLFTKIPLICEEEGLFGHTHFSLDGMKLSSNAAKEWSGKFSDFQKKQEKLEKKVKEAIKEHQSADKKEGENNITETQKREKRIKGLKQKAERIEKYLSSNKPKISTKGKEIQSNVTDNEPAKMAATSHGVLQGYNANAMVDEKHQTIVNAKAFGKGEDSNLMEPMLEGTMKNLEAIGIKEPLKDKTLSSDTGYYSINNLNACKEYEVDAYVPDQQFRKRDIRFADADRHRRPVDKKKTDKKKKYFSVEDFNYDDEQGKIICPEGHSLYVRSKNWADKKGNKGTIYQGTKKACGECKLRTECLRKPDKTVSRQVTIIYGNRPGSVLDEMRKKIDTPEGQRHTVNAWV